MPPKEVTTGYRRNGRKQACEPCRKGKLACDHGAPFCGRCVRRITTSRCIYHPAPMTRGRVQSNLPTPQQTLSITSDAAGHLAAPQSSGPTHSRSQEQVVTPSSRDENEVIPNRKPTEVPKSPELALSSQKEVFGVRFPKKGWQTKVYPRSSRYYGSTSFSSIFSEHQAKLNEGLLEIGEEKRKHPGAWLFGQPLLGRDRPDGPTVREKQVVKALW